MKHNLSSKPKSRGWRRWLPPAAAAGAGGTSMVIWFEELIALAADFIGVIVLPVLASILYILNHFIFKSAMPKAGDYKK